MKNIIEIEPMDEALLSEAERAFALSTQITTPILTGLQTLLETVPAYRLNKLLRKLLIDYLLFNIEALPIDFEELLGDFYWLTNFLDKVHEEEYRRAS